MGNASELGGQINESEMVALTGRIMMLAGIGVFLVVAGIFLIHLYTRWFWHRRPDLVSNAGAGARRDDNQDVAIRLALRKGLDLSVLKTIPEVEFSSKEFKDGLECVVCLCEVSEGEKARFLPKCNHGFHVECIDTWFQSHSTCPLCRNPIANPNSAESALEPIPGAATASAEAPNFPTNVLFWGDDTQVSTLGPCLDEPRREPVSTEVPCSSSAAAKVGAGAASISNRADGMLVIDIPRQIVEDDQESPMITRLRSLRRLLSRGKRVDRCPCGPSVNINVEQGGRSQC